MIILIITRCFQRARIFSQSLRRMLSPKSRTVRIPKGWTQRRGLRSYLEIISVHSRALKQTPTDWNWKALVLYLGLERKGWRKAWRFCLHVKSVFSFGLTCLLLHLWLLMTQGCAYLSQAPLKAKDTEVSHCPIPATTLEVGHMNKTLQIRPLPPTAQMRVTIQDCDPASWRPDHLARSPFLPSLKWCLLERHLQFTMQNRSWDKWVRWHVDQGGLMTCVSASFLPLCKPKVHARGLKVGFRSVDLPPLQRGHTECILLPIFRHYCYSSV